MKTKEMETLRWEFDAFRTDTEVAQKGCGRLRKDLTVLEARLASLATLLGTFIEAIDNKTKGGE